MCAGGVVLVLVQQVADLCLRSRAINKWVTEGHWAAKTLTIEWIRWISVRWSQAPTQRAALFCYNKEEAVCNARLTANGSSMPTALTLIPAILLMCKRVRKAR